LTRAAFPEIVRSIRSASRARFRVGVLRVGLACLLAAGAVMALVALAGRNLLVLVGGHDFGAGYVYLLWLAGAGAIELAASAFEPILLSVHRALSATFARAAAVALQMALMLALLPRVGALGASISVFAGSVAASVLLGAVLWHYAMRHGLEEPVAG
jgi:O-antigen/teichoic acid export membrane protein